MDINKLRRNPIIKLKKINEAKLNQTIDLLDEEQLLQLVSRRPKSNNKETILVKPIVEFSRGVSKLVTQLNLLDENIENRYALLLGYCNFKQYKPNTIKTYIRELEQAKVLDVKYKRNIDPSKFAVPRILIIEEDDFKKILTYCLTNLSRSVAPILIVSFTGLRTMELLQISNFTLTQLDAQLPIVSSVTRKHTSKDSKVTFWEPTYTKYLKWLISILIDLYKIELNTYKESSVVLPLFPIKASGIVKRAQSIYINALNKIPPPGFGIHSFRHMIASTMANDSSDIASIQKFLQHKKPETTVSYIHHHVRNITTKVNEIMKPTFGPMIDTLNQLG